MYSDPAPRPRPAVGRFYERNEADQDGEDEDDEEVKDLQPLGVTCEDSTCKQVHGDDEHGVEEHPRCYLFKETSEDAEASVKSRGLISVVDSVQNLGNCIQEGSDGQVEDEPLGKEYPFLEEDNDEDDKAAGNHRHCGRDSACQCHIGIIWSIIG